MVLRAPRATAEAGQASDLQAADPTRPVALYLPEEWALTLTKRHLLREAFSGHTVAAAAPATALPSAGFLALAPPCSILNLCARFPSSPYQASRHRRAGTRASTGRARVESQDLLSE